MVDRFTVPSIELAALTTAPFARADLIFYDIDHSGHSFEARVFLDDPDADHSAGPDHPSYAGSWFVFGHGGCFGDVGHCDLPGHRDGFDLRPAHQLEPAIRVLTVTDSVRALVEQGSREMSVTVVAHTAGRQSNQVLTFSTLRLAAYA